MGLDSYICDELYWAIRETLRASGEEELTLVGRCIGGTLCAIYAALHPDTPMRNLILLTTPVDTNGSLYRKWVGRDSFDVDYVSDVYQAVPGADDRLGEQIDEARGQLLDDLPPVVGGRECRRG
jgi:polyhydroxyalkanoate synthase